MRPFLVTGFEPYGGRGINPAHEIMKLLDGTTINGTTVIGRGLPVSFRSLKDRISALVEEISPAAVISIGLWPGEPTIRLERIGVNVADFEIADNDGEIMHDAPISANGAAGRLASLPLREIERALLAEGIPARVSATAGTFLCNACLYSLLEAADAQAQRMPCGFIHVPYMPEQVAGLLADTRKQARIEVHQRADLPSMDIVRSRRAVEIAIAETLRVAGV